MGGGLDSGISINPEAGYTWEDGHSSDVGNDVPTSLILPHKLMVSLTIL